MLKIKESCQFDKISNNYPIFFFVPLCLCVKIFINKVFLQPPVPLCEIILNYLFSNAREDQFPVAASCR